MLQIRKGGHRDLERFYNMFEVDFAETELRPKQGIHMAVTKGALELLIVYDEESKVELGYALCFCRGVYGYVLLKYFGILPWYRNKGLGVQAMPLVNKHYAESHASLAEITVFDPQDQDTLRKLRKFFSRFGYE